jgi:phosphinothricin acetyltransferase
MNNIRKAEVKDLSLLTEIYNQAILPHKYTCDLEVLTTQQSQKWFDEHQTDRFSIFVYEIEKKIAGYAYISPYWTGRSI